MTKPKPFRTSNRCGEAFFKPKADDVCQDTHLNNPLHNLGIQNTLNDILSRAPLTDLPYNRVVNLYDMERVFKASGVRNAAIADLNLDPQCLMQRLHSVGVIGPSVPDDHINLIKHMRVASNLTDLTGYQFLPDAALSKIKSLKDPQNALTSWGLLTRYHSLRSRLEQGVILTAKPGRHSLEEDLKCYNRWSDCSRTGDVNAGYVFSTTIEDFGEIFLSSRHMLVKTEFGSWIGTRDHYLMLHDCIAQRWICLFATSLAEFFGQQNYPSVKSILKVLEWGDDLLNRVGNEGYAAIKIWESLIYGLIMASEEDPVVDSTAFLKNMEKDLAESVPGDSGYVSESWEALKDEVLTHQNLHQLSQLHGLYRIWGHPSIDILEGLRKLREVACTPRLTCHNSVHYQWVSWREQFCVGYYNEEHRWPSVTILETMPPRSLVKQCLESGSPLPLNSPQYDLDDWAHIRFEKTFTVPAKFDLNSTTKDSATSLGFAELKDRILSKGTIGSSAERSVIVRFLSREWTTPEDFLSKIDREGFDGDERVIGLREKERELSLTGRFFGLLPIEKRIYVVVTEAMIAEELLHYVPEITMTYNQVKLREHIQRATKRLKTSEENTVTVVTNMDFVKWNSNMREEETQLLFQDIDHLFGFEALVSRTYEMFRESQMYLANGHVIPEIGQGGKRLKDGLTVWGLHAGGVEGLRQKGWTLFTVSLIKKVARMMGLNCTLMGQGDNQVLVTTYSKKEGVTFREQHEEFMKVLTKCLSCIGPPLKPEETWSSSHLFSYGKYAVWKGAPLSNALKMVVKLARMTNEGLQNLSSTLSSITANCTAATDVDVSPLVAYVICALESSVAVELSLSRPFFSESSSTAPEMMRYFRIPSSGVSLRIPVEKDTRITSQLTRFTRDGLLMLLLAPSSLGGYPVCHYWSLQMHGFPDQLSLDIQGLKMAYLRTEKALVKDAIHRLLYPPFNSEVNPLMLCQDPYSLNLLHGSSSVDKIKGMVLDYLVGHGANFIQNEHFLDFLSLAIHDQKQLGDLLYSSNHLHPRVCNAVMESTIVGKVNQALSKVTKTGVLIHLMLKFKYEALEAMHGRSRLDGYETDEVFDEGRRMQKRRTFFELFGSFEQNQVNCLVHTLCLETSSMDKEPVDQLCTYRHAKALRDTSWGKSIEGVTVAVPWELLGIHHSNFANCDLDQHPNKMGGYILTTVVGTVDIPYSVGDSGHISMGPVTPYLGKGTKNKVDYEAKKLAEQAPPILRSALNLIQLVGWATSRESKFSDLLFRIVESVTDAPVRHMAPLPDEIAGTFGHRFDDVKTSRMCTSSIIPTGASYIMSNTNHFSPENLMEDLGTDNLHMQFQSIFLFIQHYLSVKHLFEGNPTQDVSYHWHIKCPGCVYPVKEEMIELEVDEVPWEEFKFLEKQPQNPYLWVPVDSLPTQLVPTENWGNAISVPEDASYDQVSYLLVQALVTDIMSHHGLLSPSFRSGSIEAAYEIPVTIVTKLPFVLFLQELIFALFLRLCWIHATRLDYHERYQSMIPWISGHLNTLRQIPFPWFKPFHRLLEHPDNLSKALKRWATVNPPIGSPPEENQISAFFQELIRREVDHPSFVERFRSWCDPRSNRGKLQLLQHGLHNHPTSKWAISSLVGGNADDRVWYFVRFLKHASALFSDANITSISDLSSLAVVQDSPHKHLEALTVRFSMTKFLNTDPPRDFVVGNHHGISAALAPRIRPDLMQREPVSDNIDPLPFPKTRSAKLLVTVKYDGELVIRQETTKSITPEMPMSNINHLFKPYKNPTTAHYKLLSVLYLCESLRIPLPTRYPMRLLGVADGDGGFCQLLHRIWPAAEIVYNSLYDIKRMTASGAGAVRPSSIFGSDSLSRKAVGLQLVEEGLSDLTKERTLDAIIKNFPSGDLLVCDAEGDGVNSPGKELLLANQVSLLSFSLQCPLVIYKTYTRSVGLCHAVINIWLAHYKTVRVVRTFFSGYGNTEVYLVITDRHETRLRVPRATPLVNPGEIHLSHELSNVNWKQFSEYVSNPQDYTVIPHSMSPEYTNILTPLPVKQLWRQELSNLLSRFGGERRFLFPDSFIRSLNQQLSPVTLSRSTPATWVISYFTPSIKTEVFTHFFLSWGISILYLNNRPEIWSEWVNCTKIIRLLCYQTIEGKWSIWPMVPGEFWPKLTACILISESDVPESARKNIISTMARYVYDSNVPEDLRPTTGFCSGFPSWRFRKIKRREVPQIFQSSGSADYSLHWRFSPIPDRSWLEGKNELLWFFPLVSSHDRVEIRANYYRLLNLDPQV
ncbi:MAG: RNA-dependent RNA polymerase [Elisy virus]|uniref:Replicase n=1 Tax=Elisy virus TaxID=2800914 RepID=A0A894KKV4_9RHAB|nr:MAG: RNA-dependent RNA polymerase [Elisy virus]